MARRGCNDPLPGRVERREFPPALKQSARGSRTPHAPNRGSEPPPPKRQSNLAERVWTSCFKGREILGALRRHGEQRTPGGILLGDRRVLQDDGASTEAAAAVAVSVVLDLCSRRRLLRREDDLPRAIDRGSLSPQRRPSRSPRWLRHPCRRDPRSSPPSRRSGSEPSCRPPLCRRRGPKARRGGCADFAANPILLLGVARGDDELRASGNVSRGDRRISHDDRASSGKTPPPSPVPLCAPGVAFVVLPLRSPGKGCARAGSGVVVASSVPVTVRATPPGISATSVLVPATVLGQWAMFPLGATSGGVEGAGGGAGCGSHGRWRSPVRGAGASRRFRLCDTRQGRGRDNQGGPRGQIESRNAPWNPPRRWTNVGPPPFANLARVEVTIKVSRRQRLPLKRRGSLPPGLVAVAHGGWRKCTERKAVTRDPPGCYRRATAGTASRDRRFISACSPCGGSAIPTYLPSSSARTLLERSGNP